LVLCTLSFVVGAWYLTMVANSIKNTKPKLHAQSTKI
jgi:hypothetical protein